MAVRRTGPVCPGHVTLNPAGDSSDAGPVGTTTAAPEATLRAVVCDDDPLIRTVIARVAEQAGVAVVAEADDPSSAVELLQRYQAQELILDLSLRGGRGEDALDIIRSRDLRCRTVVFSSFSGDADRLLKLGATAVVDKPDFGALEEVLRRHAESGARPDGERRRTRSVRDMPPVPRFVSPSGVAPPTELAPLLVSMRPGDAVMSVSVDGIDRVSAEHGSIVAADHLLHAARVVRHGLRVQDRLVVGNDGSLLLLLFDGAPEAARAVFERMAREWQGSGALGELRAGYALVDDDTPPSSTVTRAVSVRVQATRDVPFLEG